MVVNDCAATRAILSRLSAVLVRRIGRIMVIGMVASLSIVVIMRMIEIRLVVIGSAKVPAMRELIVANIIVA